MTRSTKGTVAVAVGCHARVVAACTMVIAFICTVATTSISQAQIGQAEWGANRASDGLALIDEVHSRAATAVRIEPRRSSISVVRNRALLVDSRVGRTWLLVLGKIDRPSHWKTSARKKCCGAKNRQPSRPSVPLTRAARSEIDSFDPFQAETAEPKPRSQDEPGAKPPTVDAGPPARN